MKKILVFAFCFISFLLFTNDAYASNKANGNLLDLNKVCYDSNSHKFYSNQNITFYDDRTYTVVVSKKFFNEGVSVNGTFFETTVDSGMINFVFDYSAHTGVYYATAVANGKTKMKINNFLISGNSVDDFNKDLIILYEGTIKDFKGFEKYVNLDGYNKAVNKIFLTTEYTNKISIDTITNSLMAYDAQDGALDNIEIICDEYTNSNKTGSFLVTYKATDSAGNEVFVSVNILVIDLVCPEISGPTEIVWDMSKPIFSEEEFLKMFTANDFIDGDVSDRISLKKGSLNDFKLNEKNDLTLVVSVTDLTGNETEMECQIKAIDITPPDLIVKDVTVNLSECFTDGINSLLEKVVVSCSDNYSKFTITYECLELVDDNGFVGKYLVTVMAVDRFNNKTIKEAYLTIKDDIPPDFYFKMDLLTTTTANTYSVEELKIAIENQLYKTGILYEDIKLISSDYFTNEKNPGDYQVKFIYLYNNDVNYFVGTIKVEREELPSSIYILISIGCVSIIGISIFIYNKKHLIS